MNQQQEISLTADAVIFIGKKEMSRVLLIKRKNDPFINQWALPGGFVEPNELAVHACKRELLEETGVSLKRENLKFVNYYDALSREPRGRTITFAYMSVLTDQPDVSANDDASEAQWFFTDQLPELAFDHLKIIRDALQL